nr:PREDICTED: lanC-like protein 1 isoform X1 [Bemisia tabaci]XP_018902619.1 PREDICTED: lanC-like protein 1 isoform X1 [Bemisia tabaci]
MQIATDRFYPNNYEDFRQQPNMIIHEKDNKITLHPTLVEKLNTKIRDMLGHIGMYLKDSDRSDGSLYSGAVGIALMFQRLAMHFNDKNMLQKAADLVSNALPLAHRKYISYLIGAPGVYATAAVLSYQNHDTKSMNQFVKKVLELSDKLNGDVPDEILYGRSGYLHSLLFLRHRIGNDIIDGAIVRQVVSKILSSGQELARRDSWKCPLMYEWHDSYYLGAAHGLAGIMYTLLLAREFLSEPELNSLVRPTVDFLLQRRHPSTNLASSIGSNSDKLVQWCHGAPGAVQLFSLAYQVFGHEKYRVAALECGEVTWERGILRKGYNLCHGVAGNGYTFLNLYQLTKDPKYLYRAGVFADWCLTHDQNQAFVPSRPFSLYEGIAGVIFFLVDVQDPLKAKFPAYEL